MSNNNGLFTDGAETFNAQVNAIPLSDVDATNNKSIGALVSNATSQISTLVRSEIELAKAEIAGEVKKGAIGGGLFGVAGTIALYSSFFFFFFLAELLADLWLPRWASFLIVFVFMLVLAGLFAFIGLQKVKKIGAPKKTIESVGELKSLVPGQAQAKLEASNRGMYS
ncbi:phage holin family protein [Corynebacterium sp. sy017]|uniref:phage holin family protein n=1 Tax=unclassified Corynebacterium TaxID=2624378 RepID=UPI001186F22E|nr:MULTISPECIES: phage holin family protein [unclassified Corynebacterium]MBP3089393.1 phage holin family protein [Corynebacterium sp. sy017]QDZ43321.1 phage holin family protein [Corynebacterium sp. sy039]TSD90917.1 phage holin family protein [Corynebacterium sp. SY003]